MVEAYDVDIIEIMVSVKIGQMYLLLICAIKVVCNLCLQVKRTRESAPLEIFSLPYIIYECIYLCACSLHYCYFPILARFYVT